MARKSRHDAEASAADEQPSERDSADRQGAGGEESLARRLDRLTEECDELRAQALRAQADYQNLRRRHLSDVEAGIRKAVMPLLEELLLVADYLDLALAVRPSSDEAKNLYVGVEMTRTKLMQALEREDVRPIRADGAFDPELHEATGTEPSADVAPGTILRIARPGYTWRGLVLRHAHVIVAAEPAAVAGEGEERD